MARTDANTSASNRVLRAGDTMTGSLNITGGSTLSVNNGAVINEGGADSDTRIEGDTDQNLVFVDASTDRLGIGTSTPQSKLDVIGNFRFRDAGAATKAVKYDFGGAIDCAAGGNDFYISVFDNGDFTGTQAFHIIMQKASNGGNTLFNRKAIFNDSSGDFDFQIKGDTDDNILYGDASTDRIGIGTNSPGAKLDVNGTSLHRNGAAVGELAALDSGLLGGIDAPFGTIAGNNAVMRLVAYHGTQQYVSKYGPASWYISHTDGTGETNVLNTYYDHIEIANSTYLTVDGTVAVKAGTSSGQIAKVGGTIFSYNTDAGNSGTSETDLYTDSIPANTLSTNKDKLEARYAGEMVNSATATRQLKVYFGGTAIFDTGTLSLSAASDWDLDVMIIRVSSSVVRYSVKLNLTGASLSAYANVGELTGLTLSNANTLKITGQAAGVGAASNDIVAKLGTVEWKAAP